MHYMCRYMCFEYDNGVTGSPGAPVSIVAPVSLVASVSLAWPQLGLGLELGFGLWNLKTSKTPWWRNSAPFIWETYTPSLIEQFKKIS